jgi:cell wall assembly regulator SMI1
MVKKDEGDVPRPTEPPAVADSWKRIEAWLDAHLPPYKHTLRPGLSKKDLAKFEKAVGMPLPEDVRQSLRIHDGQCHLPDDVFDALFDETPEKAPPSLIGVIFGEELLDLESALREWRRWAKVGEENWDEMEWSQTSTPEGAVQRCYTTRGWIPLGALTHSDYFGVDLNPGPNGVVGQVVNFGRDEENKYVLATSWAQFLSDVADELEAGNFAVDPKRECEEFQMIRPRRGTFMWNLKEWSAAKLAGKLLE